MNWEEHADILAIGAHELLDYKKTSCEIWPDVAKYIT